MESTVIHHMVDNIINGQQSDALAKFHEVVALKLADALEAKKIEFAAAIGKDQEEHEEV